jgi:hypothetical protein
VTRAEIQLAMEQWYTEDLVGLIYTMQALGLGKLEPRELIFCNPDFETQNWAVRCLDARNAD